MARWLHEHEHHSLRHYWEQLLARAGKDIAVLRSNEDAAELMSLLARYEAAQTLFHQAHLALAVRQLAIVGVEIGTGGTSFKDYLARYGKESRRSSRGCRKRRSAQPPDRALSADREIRS